MTKRQNQLAPARLTNDSTLPDETAASITFADHIGELRRRTMWVALAFFVASSVAYSYRDILMQAIMAPLDGGKLIYLTPGGGFSFIFQVTLYAGLLAAAPMLIYQLYGFMRPALPMHARRSAPKVVICAVLLMLAGVSYGYFVAVPSALHFLNTFAGEDILPSLTADSYLSFFLAYIAGLGALFQLPLLLMFWHWVKPMGPSGLLKSERWVILFSFVAAAIITPTPDVVNQAMIAIPLILIYQLGVVAVIVSIMRERRKQRRAQVPAIQPSQPVEVSLAPFPVPEQMPPRAVQPSPEMSRPVKTPIPTVAPATSVLYANIQSKLVTRPSVDGFAVRPHRAHSMKRAPARQLLNSHSRPLRTSPVLRQRPTLSIDGILAT